MAEDDIIVGEEAERGGKRAAEQYQISHPQNIKSTARINIIQTIFRVTQCSQCRYDPEQNGTVELQH